ncbi:hypothetical protein [Rheinheimera sp.]|nr:hypothetical protein [Rheinheimera sp.]MDP2713833.1 hypothetical protein [Rheinheimera sp.]
MAGFLYMLKNSLRVRALIFFAMAGLISFGMFGWSIFQSEDFKVAYGHQ